MLAESIPPTKSNKDDGDDDENKITTMSSNKKLEKPPIISIASPIYKPNNIGDDHDHDDNDHDKRVEERKGHYSVNENSNAGEKKLSVI